jgi:NADPH:quinone reductase-like Zn-dependent oxidoreductase
MASANLDLVRSIYTMWERGDFTSAEWAHPEIEYVAADGPAPGGSTGLAGMAENFRDWLSTWQALFDRGGLERGQTALIAGAAGGVGHLAVQFAKIAGARVIGTGSSRNRDFVLGLGTDEYLDYTEQDVGQAVSGVDLAFDTVGGDTTQSLVPTVREGGILVTIANAPPEDAARARGVRAELLVMSPSSEQLSRIAELVADGEVRVEISEVLPLAEVQQSHELSESGHNRGKIVLTV